MHGLETIIALNAAEIEKRKAAQVTCAHDWQGRISFWCPKCNLVATATQRAAIDAQAKGA